jgi:hypothetical protein
MKNYRTPRTQAEAEFTTGHPIIPRNRPPIGLSSWALAVAIGVALAWAVVYGWHA